ncbi:DNA-binding response regulator [Lysinibacillus macroides]|uniref:Transcriptional regulator n=1 Tax=Lysinibacillus macroides TaxID=33935 RepID=A0A0M9DLD5_9BACI|nr:DNA-binding response regulator [Lysinibacillus macroides]KOY83798.1 transcriptional regulator [Lysinibacillus macroides]QPR67064.1 DNA-binding response regulator [Lysinibacillus macroides]
MLKAIIVDDEILAIDLLEAMLQGNSAVSVVGKFLNPLEAFTNIPTLKPDILFLDIEMTEMDGIEFASKVRKLSYLIDIVFVTAYEQYAIEAFTVQAVDYILKPFDRERLTKTIERISLRRKQFQSKTTVNLIEEDACISIENFHFHVHSRRVYIDHTAFVLSTKEFQIFFFLAQRPGQIFHPTDLYKHIWAEESIGHTQALKAHISNLRKKLESAPGHRAKIVTVRGSGYQLLFES